MKKLLLFTLVLFGSIGTITMADSMCGANGQFDPGSNTCRPIQSGYGTSSPSSTSKLYGAVNLTNYHLKTIFTTHITFTTIWFCINT